MSTNDIIEKAGDFQEEETSQSLKEKALQWQRIAKENTIRAAQATDSYVRENPWSVLTTVALAAFALGLLIGNRRS